MALSEKQSEQIQSEIAELALLNIEELNEDQVRGHYERCVELTNTVISHSNDKALATQLLTLATSFDPKGSNLQELTASVERMTEPEAPEDEGPAKNELKTGLVAIRVKLKEKSKGKNVSGKAVLKAALKENGIEFSAKDSEEELGQTLKAWLEAEPEAPEVPEPPAPAPEPPKPVETNLDEAKKLANELIEYSRAFADQQRAAGKDSVRYNKFARELERLVRVRLI